MSLSSIFKLIFLGALGYYASIQNRYVCEKSFYDHMTKDLQVKTNKPQKAKGKLKSNLNAV